MGPDISGIDARISHEEMSAGAGACAGEGVGPSIGDDEGVTINTRLALEDMDALFGADAFGEVSGFGGGGRRGDAGVLTSKAKAA